MNRDKFFALVRTTLSGGSLTQSQVDGLSKILDEWERRGLSDIRWLAYMLATVWHETGARVQPVAENGGEAYLKSKTYFPFFGRGLVQCTWQANYAKFGVTNPDDMLTWPYALKALFDGMIDGVFTGKKLGDYFSDRSDDAISARRIINGTDRAGLIAGYHIDFLAAIKAGNTTSIAAKPAALPSVITPSPRPADNSLLAHLKAWWEGKAA